MCHICDIRVLCIQVLALPMDDIRRYILVGVANWKLDARAELNAEAERVGSSSTTPARIVKRVCNMEGHSWTSWVRRCAARETVYPRFRVFTVPGVSFMRPENCPSKVQRLLDLVKELASVTFTSEGVDCAKWLPSPAEVRIITECCLTQRMADHYHEILRANHWMQRGNSNDRRMNLFLVQLGSIDRVQLSRQYWSHR